MFSFKLLCNSKCYLFNILLDIYLIFKTDNVLKFILFLDLQKLKYDNTTVI